MAETYDPNGIFAGDKDYKHRSVTYLAGRIYTRGEVLGRVTASDKYNLSASAAADGSQAPVAVCPFTVDATAGDVVAAAYVEGDFAAEFLTYGAGHTAATVEASWRQNNLPLYVRKLGAVA